MNNGSSLINLFDKLISFFVESLQFSEFHWETPLLMPKSYYHRYLSENVDIWKSIEYKFLLVLLDHLFQIDSSIQIAALQDKLDLFVVKRVEDVVIWLLKSFLHSLVQSLVKRVRIRHFLVFFLVQFHDK